MIFLFSTTHFIFQHTDVLLIRPTYMYTKLSVKATNFYGKQSHNSQALGVVLEESVPSGGNILKSKWIPSFEFHEKDLLLILGVSESQKID